MDSAVSIGLVVSAAAPPASQAAVLPIDLRPPFLSQASVPAGLASVRPESVQAVQPRCPVWVVEQAAVPDSPRVQLNGRALAVSPRSPFRSLGSVVVAVWVGAA